MREEGVFLNPDSGDVTATGQISATQFAMPTKDDLRVGLSSFYSIVTAESTAKSKVTLRSWDDDEEEEG